MSWKLKNLRMVMESLQGRDVQLDSYLVDTEMFFSVDYIRTFPLD